jgi:hypothetical protein
MPNSVPFEVIAAPFEVWFAPVGEAFPAVNATPAGNWVKVGTSGALNYMEDVGVVVVQSQEIAQWRSLGDTATRKVFRTGESLQIRLTLADVSLEQYRHALNMNAITDTAAGSGTAGFRKIGLSRGPDVAQRALLVKGSHGPYGAEMPMQYEIPLAFQTGSPEVVYRKDVPAGLALEWTAIIDPNAASPSERFGRLVAMDADPA